MESGQSLIEGLLGFLGGLVTIVIDVLVAWLGDWTNSALFFTGLAFLVVALVVTKIVRKNFWLVLLMMVFAAPALYGIIISVNIVRESVIGQSAAMLLAIALAFVLASMAFAVGNRKQKFVDILVLLLLGAAFLWLASQPVPEWELSEHARRFVEDVVRFWASAAQGATQTVN